MTDTLTPEQIAYVRELTYGIRNGDGQHVEDELVEWCCKHLNRMLDERAAQARRIEELEAALDKSALTFCKLENERVFLEAENARLREENDAAALEITRQNSTISMAIDNGLVELERFTDAYAKTLLEENARLQKWQTEARRVLEMVQFGALNLKFEPICVCCRRPPEDHGGY